MAKHDFSALFAQYAAVIAQMPGEFTSHEFILNLARSNQALYIDALAAYRDVCRRGFPTPFMIVHSILARRLSAYPELVKRLESVPSSDIFGRSSECAQWQKYRATQFSLPGVGTDICNRVT